MDLNQKIQNYNEAIKTAKSKFERIIKEDFPMETGWAFKVKSHPIPTIEQGESAIKSINELRTNLTQLREEIKTQRKSEVEEKIQELGKLIGTKDYSKKKTTDAKWVIEARSQAIYNESIFNSAFWSETHQAINVITKWISERKVIEQNNRIQLEKNAEMIWCKNYLNQKMGTSFSLLNTLKSETIIDMAHQHLKDEFSKVNELTGEKCYCESHDENRHYHFADTYWNGTEVTVFETSETY
jgi:hypothetical protein